MATSSAELNGSGPFQVRLDVSAGEQNIAGNYTRFYWALYVVCSANGWPSYTSQAGSWSVNIAGVAGSGTFVVDFRPSNSSARTVLLGNFYVDVPHLADGTRPAFPNYGSIDTSHASVGDGTTVTYADAPTIPRASTAVWAVQGVKYAGTTHQLNMNRASTGFTHTVEYFFGSKYGVIGTGVTDSVNWTLPADLIDEIPNTPTGVGIIRTTTYSGGNWIGSRDSGFTVTVPLDVVPTLTDITVAEATPGLAAIVGGYVQGLSKLDLAIVGAAGAGGSSVASQKLEILSGTTVLQTINSASGVSGPINASGTVSLRATVTDTRGRSAERVETIQVIPYSTPNIISAGVRRSSLGGVVVDDGAYFRVDINAAVSSLMVSSTQKNALGYKISSRERGETTWTLRENITPGGIAFNSFKTVGPFSVTNAYDILIEVYDQFTTSAIMVTMPVASVFMHWDGSQGVGFGKYREDGRLDIMGDVWVREDVVEGHKGHVFIAGTYHSKGEPIAARGTTAERDTLYGVPSGVSQQAALANRKVRYFNMDRGWEESYYAPAGTTGLTALGLDPATAPGWYPTGEGPYSKLFANAAISLSNNAYFTTFAAWGTGVSKRRGGAGWFSYDPTQGGVTCLVAGQYEIEGYITRQAGTGEPTCHILRNGNSVYTGMKDLSPGSVSDQLLHVPLIDAPINSKFTLFNAVGAYTGMVATGQPEVRGSFVVKYKAPLFASE